MGHRPEIVFHIVPNASVPKGLAVAVANNRVMWVGPANVLDVLAMNAWPPGTYLNLSLTDHEIIKSKLPKAEGIPMQ